MKKVYSYKVIADYFIALSNETQSPITNLKLQKLVFYAQAWNLAILKKELIAEDFEAWVHGPVIPELYKDYSSFGWKPILREDLTSEVFSELKKTIDDEVLKVLGEVEYEYFGLQAYELEKLTHNEDPWILTRVGLTEDQPSNKIISKELISAYYSKFVVNE
ncbi:Panacea domain-containing protein [Ferruginibacter sp. HRS2-29]|uniref:Panacea domain-containing protein n=1 Tax=Ferruginibacter sp. HRS2-29 TaxID=2487334 RepID=UPI0020CB979F|nr:type II toxin-antitoxin system antitoxin SocA domain-containing protein [Ferruginibacter sp. HRS2-29]MCP9750460.1 DUF4065 domain-containing protein [Ferruginibacter sp. HRS2-29]